MSGRWLCECDFAQWKGTRGMITLETLHVEIDGPTATITLNRPDKKNAMNPQMHQDMHKALDAVEADDDVKVLVIAGRGDSFSAGMDLEECFLQPFNEPM